MLALTDAKMFWRILISYLSMIARKTSHLAAQSVLIYQADLVGYVSARDQIPAVILVDREEYLQSAR